MQKKDGMMYAPVGKSERVCAPGEFPIAAIGLDHGHIYGMCNGLIEAGADLCSVWDPDPDKMEAFQKTYGQVKCVADKQQILDDKSIRLIASASIPSSLDIRAVASAIDFTPFRVALCQVTVFINLCTDKPPV